MYDQIESITTAITRKKSLTPVSTPNHSPKPKPKRKPGNGNTNRKNGASSTCANDNAISSYQKNTVVQVGDDQRRIDDKNNDDNYDDVDESTSSSKKLKRTLGVMDLIFYGIGCSVGAGIYSLVGIGAKTAGPAISLSFGLCGIACCFTSLSYAEFAARVPLAGSAYTFTYVSFGELAGWLVGWNLTLGYAVSAAAVSRSWAVYVSGFLEGLLRSDDGGASSQVTLFLDHALQWLVKAPMPASAFFENDDSINNKDNTCCPLAAIVIMMCTIVLITGAKESARFNTIMTILNLSVLALVVVSGLVTSSVRSENLGFSSSSIVEPSEESSFFGINGFDGVGRAAGLVFFSYLGFDMVSCLSEEVINPEKNMPIGIVGSLVSSTVIYCTVSLVVVGMAPIALLGEDTPVVNCLLANACCTHEEQIEDVTNHSDTNGPFDCLSYSSCGASPSSSSSNFHYMLLLLGSKVVSFGAIFGLTTATFACLMGQPRIFYSMAQDGLLFDIYGKVDVETGVPTAGTILTGIMTAFVACFVDLESLANTISLGTLMVFTFVNAGVIVMRTSATTPPMIIEEDEGSGGRHDCDVCDAENDPDHHEADHYHIVSDIGTDHEKSRLIKNKNVASSKDVKYHVHKNYCSKHSSHLLPDDGGLMLMKKLSYLSSSSKSSSSSSSFAAEGGLASKTTTTTITAPSTTVCDGIHDSNDDTNINGSKPYLFTFLFTVFAVLASTGLSHGWPVRLLIVLLLLMIFSASVLFGLKQQQTSSSFQCPFVPAVPLMGMLCNSYMMGSMPSSTWYVITIWLLIGLCFYFTYGIHHSKLQKM